jgi:hypothetical protein
MTRAAALIGLCLLATSLAQAPQPYELPLKGGHVIDARNGIDAVRGHCSRMPMIRSVSRPSIAQPRA